MRIHTLLVYRWNDAGKLALEREEGYEYHGPVAVCKGASAQQDNLAAQQATFYSTVTAQQGQQFAQQSAILAALQKAWGPILAKGPGQHGFTPEETAALRTQASEGTALDYQKAKGAVEASLAARGGGTEVLPSGAEDQIRAQMATEEAANESGKQLNITQADYQQGLGLFQAASQAMSGTASIYNPLGFANATTQAGQSAFDEATKIQEENSSSGLWGALGGILGGAASAFTGGLGGSLGGALGGKLFGAGAKAGCWIAEAIYGVEDPRTHLLRYWLNYEFTKSFVGRQVMALYRFCGEWVAKQVKRFTIVRRTLTPLFELALKKARAWEKKL